MPQVYKVVFFFRLQNQGWTETYYRLKETAVDAATFAPDPEVETIAWRSYGVILDAIRASRVDPPRESFILQMDARANANVNQIPDITATSGLVALFGPNQIVRRNVWLRGLIDSQTIRNALTGASTPSAALTQSINGYIHWLQGNECLIQRLQPIDPILVPRQPVRRFEQDTTASLTRVIPLSGTLPLAGSSVIFGKTDRRQTPGLRGKFRVLAIFPAAPPTPAYFLIEYRMPSATAVETGGAYYRPAIYSYVGIANHQFVRFSTRDTGRPIIPSRGAQPRTLLRQ